MGRKPLDAANCLVKTLDLPISPEAFNTELYSSLEGIFPEATLMPGKVFTCKIPSLLQYVRK